jgi:hypothetical protein
VLIPPVLREQHDRLTLFDREGHVIAGISNRRAEPHAIRYTRVPATPLIEALVRRSRALDRHAARAESGR